MMNLVAAAALLQKRKASLFRYFYEYYNNQNSGDCESVLACGNLVWASTCSSWLFQGIEPRCGSTSEMTWKARSCPYHEGKPL